HAELLRIATLSLLHLWRFRRHRKLSAAWAEFSLTSGYRGCGNFLTGHVQRILSTPDNRCLRHGYPEKSGNEIGFPLVQCARAFAQLRLREPTFRQFCRNL